MHYVSGPFFLVTAAISSVILLQNKRTFLQTKSPPLKLCPSTHKVRNPGCRGSNIYSCFVLSRTNLFHQQNLQLLTFMLKIINKISLVYSTNEQAPGICILYLFRNNQGKLLHLSDGFEWAVGPGLGYTALFCQTSLFVAHHCPASKEKWTMMGQNFCLCLKKLNVMCILHWEIENVDRSPTLTLKEGLKRKSHTS